MATKSTFWSLWRELNSRPLVYETSALTTELQRLGCSFESFSWNHLQVKPTERSKEEKKWKASGDIELSTLVYLTSALTTELQRLWCAFGSLSWHQLQFKRNMATKSTFWSLWRELNSRPLVYETSALTTELQRLGCSFESFSWNHLQVKPTERSKEEKKWKASGDIELSTPGLLDQCSNHWATEVVMCIWVVELTSVAIQKKYGDKKYFLKPPERIELSTPGLRNQCSNHWATEAWMFIWIFQLKSFTS